MNGELLAILEQMEREKGIDKEKLLEAIEQALVIAAKKIAKITNPEAEISVKIDRNTGKIRAFVGKKEKNCVLNYMGTFLKDKVPPDEFCFGERGN